MLLWTRNPGPYGAGLTICRRSAAKYGSPLKRVQAPRSPGSDRPLAGHFLAGSCTKSVQVRSPIASVALGGRARQRIIGRSDEERALAHHLGEHVDLKRFVEHGDDRLRIDVDVAMRVACGDHERGRLGPLLCE